MAVSKKNKDFKPVPPAADEFGFPFPAENTPDSARNKYKHRVVCPNCLDTAAAEVTLTSRGLVTLYCRFCEIRIFAGSVKSHEMMRKWAAVLEAPEIQQFLIDRLLTIP